MFTKVFLTRYCIFLLLLSCCGTVGAQSKVNANVSFEKIALKKYLKDSKSELRKQSSKLRQEKERFRRDSIKFQKGKPSIPFEDDDSLVFEARSVVTNQLKKNATLEGYLSELDKVKSLDSITLVDFEENYAPWAEEGYGISTGAVDTIVNYRQIREPFDSLTWDERLKQYSFNQVDSTVIEQELNAYLEEDLWLKRQEENQLLASFRKETFLEKSKEYFNYDQLDNEAKKAFEKVKKKENTQSFFKELLNQKSPQFDSLSTLDRLHGGTLFELNDNLQSIHVSPFLEFDLTSKVILGLGTDMKFSLDPKIALMDTRGRAYAEYKIKKYLLHFEAEIDQPNNIENQSVRSEISYLLGVGKQFTFLGKVASKMLLLYRLNNNESQKFTLRYGFQFF